MSGAKCCRNTDRPRFCSQGDEVQLQDRNHRSLSHQTGRDKVPGDPMGVRGYARLRGLQGGKRPGHLQTVGVGISGRGRKRGIRCQPVLVCSGCRSRAPRADSRAWRSELGVLAGSALVGAPFLACRLTPHGVFPWCTSVERSLCSSSEKATNAIPSGLRPRTCLARTWRATAAASCWLCPHRTDTCKQPGASQVLRGWAGRVL